jgi:aryl-alcohol dehydrogenase-like predicted oxidoreductase
MNHHSNISKITLGTVQLGIPYGLANKNGQPAAAYSHQLLQFALDRGIQTLDTARIYGNAEEVIGSFGHANQFNIISKFKLSDAALTNTDLAIAEAKESLAFSARQLKRDRIPVYLFHKNKDQEMQKVAAIIPVVLKQLKDDGLIQEGGISVYAPEELHYIQDWQHIRAVQVPMNLLDTRLLQDNRIQTLIKNHVKVFIRSIYLQGLLLMKEETLPQHLSSSKSYLQQIKTMAASVNKSVSDLAFSFVRDTPGVTSIVVGAETIEQLRENIQLLSSTPLSQSIYGEIKESFKNIPETIITPALWNI